MKYFFLFSLVFNILNTNLKCQTLHCSFGTIFAKSKAEAPIVNAKEDFSNSAYPFEFGIEYYIPKHKFSLNCNYIKYAGYTTILLNQKYDPNFPFFIAESDGFNGTTVKRVDIELRYLLTRAKSPFFLKGGIGIGFQNAKANGFEILYVPILGPDYIETAPMEAVVMENKQIVPIGSLDIGVRFFKRIEIGLFAQGAIGHKPFQRQTFKYKYKGTSQPDAVYVADGTSVYIALKVGYRFYKFIKQ